MKQKQVDNLRTVLLDVTEGEESLKVKIDKAARFWGGIDVLANKCRIAFLSLMEKSELTSLIKICPPWFT